MPILWRYLLVHYFRVFFLCTCSFIAILLVMRLEEIARFSTLGAGPLLSGIFVLHQIPYVLPIALPISSLIATILLMKRLSETNEMTALRASGWSLKETFAPILIVAILLSLLNFYIVSELATSSHRIAVNLKSQLRAVNPLLLANNKQLKRLQGFYFDITGNSRQGETASDVIFAFPSKGSKRLNIMIAKNLQFDTPNFQGKQVALISSLENKNNPAADHLVIENIENLSTTIEDFSQLIHKKISQVNNDHLRLPQLLAKMSQEQKHYPSEKDRERQKQLMRNRQRGYAEIFRRLSLAIAVLSFTFMGAAFGTYVGRQRSYKGIAIVLMLTALYLVSYFIAQKMGHVIETSILLFFLPHVLIVAASTWTLRRTALGIEVI